MILEDLNVTICRLPDGTLDVFLNEVHDAHNVKRSRFSMLINIDQVDATCYADIRSKNKGVVETKRETIQIKNISNEDI